MNLIILIGAACIAYFLTGIFDLIDGYIAKCQLIKAREKRFQNEDYKYKLIKEEGFCGGIKRNKRSGI